MLLTTPENAFHAQLLCVFTMLVCMLFGGCDGTRNEVNDRAAAIRQHISIGMHIDAAIETLKNHGYRVDNKYHPTKYSGDWQVNVPLRDHLTKVDSARYIAGAPEGVKAYLVIRADENGVITAIE